MTVSAVNAYNYNLLHNTRK